MFHRTVVEQIKQSVPRSLQAASAEPRSGDPSFKIKEMLLFCLILLKNYSDHYIHNYHYHLIIITIIILLYPHHHYHPYPHRHHHHHALEISKQACKFTVRWKETVWQKHFKTVARQCIAMCSTYVPTRLKSWKDNPSQPVKNVWQRHWRCTAPTHMMLRLSQFDAATLDRLQRFLFAILRHIRNILCNMHVSLKWRQNIRSWWTLQIGSSSSAEMKEYNQWHKCSWWLEKVIVLAAVRPNCRFRIATTISCNLGFYKLHIDNTQVLTSWNRFLSGRNGSF